MKKPPYGLTEDEYTVLKELSTPIKIQEYLDSLPINFEKKAETYMSPRRVLRTGKAHCFEGALVAGLCLMLAGEKPLILDLKTTDDDIDHVVTLYKRNGYFGAISKTNHATLRFRDPIYKTVRELALSYFHEYFLDTTGEKTLRSFSGPINLRRFGTSWITREDDLWDIVEALDSVPHTDVFPAVNKKYIRLADAMERKAGKLTEWKARDAGT